MENLRLRCPYFYDVALLLHSIERGPSLAEFAMKTFQARYKVNSPHRLYVSALNAGNRGMHWLVRMSEAQTLAAVLTSTAAYRAASSLSGHTGLARGPKNPRADTNRLTGFTDVAGTCRSCSSRRTPTRRLRR